MESRKGLAKYRAVDLFLFGLMLAVFESLIVTASTRWFPGQPYTISVVPLITAIVLVRWGIWSAVHALAGGAVLCLLSSAAGAQFAIYCIGNCFALLCLPFLSRWRREEGQWTDGLKPVVFGLAVLLLMQTGRMLVSLACGYSLQAAAGFLTTEVITDLFTLIALWIARRLDGVLEDQRHYLARLREEKPVR